MDVPAMTLERDGKNKTLWELFHSPADSPYPPTAYMHQMSDIFLNHWASIIKNGKPASPWNEFSREKMEYVEWSNKETDAIETIRSGLPPTIKYMIDNFGDNEENSSAAENSLNFVTAFLAFF